MTDHGAEQGDDVAEDQRMGGRRAMVADLAAVPAGEAVRVCGWVRAVRGRWLEVADCTGPVAVTLETLGAAAPDPPPAVGDAIEVRALTGAGPGTVQATDVRLWRRHGAHPESVDDRSARSYLRFRDPAVVELFRRTNQAAALARRYLHEHHFVELATPLVWSGSQEYGEPELAVFHPWSPGRGGYLLQSPTVPQLLCAIGGVDRSFQFSRCFRAEPGAAPWKASEFTQLNLTTAFSSVPETRELLEGLFASLNRELTGEELPRPFPRLTYRQALARFGSDTPDYRFAAFPTPGVADPDRLAYPAGPEPGETAQLVVVPGGSERLARALRGPIDRHWAREYGLWHLDADRVVPVAGPWRWRGDAGSLLAPLEEVPPAVVVALPRSEGTAPFVARLLDVVHQAVTGRRPPRFAPVWVDRPPFWRPEAPVDGAYHRSRSLFGEILTGEYDDEPGVQSYDLLLNGVELLSGGQKEPSREQLLANLRLAGVCEPESRYAYYLEALDQGAPPLHNTSVGWDRALAVLLGTTMRDVMVLPKDGDGSCPVSGVPVPV